MIPRKYNKLFTLIPSLPKDDYFPNIQAIIPTIPVRGPLIKKRIDDFSPGLNTVHSNTDDPDIGTQPHEENTIFPSRVIIQDSTVQSSVTFQYPILWQHNATSPTHNICCLMLADVLQQLRPIVQLISSQLNMQICLHNLFPSHRARANLIILQFLM